ncbi:unnamed protein product [Effrenium voratum]|uniref:EGF-like domain-containing protein n=1 Tax=Effrenium voratum TaxID=2562239 RepID=A0AA36JE58_9DINO|nr:unnamed protein product [Effrenium voratum]CAJ1429216.1 unnamed protein product [Effrenium voratum]
MEGEERGDPLPQDPSGWRSRASLPASLASLADARPERSVSLDTPWWLQPSRSPQPKTRYQLLSGGSNGSAVSAAPRHPSMELMWRQSPSDMSPDSKARETPTGSRQRSPGSRVEDLLDHLQGEVEVIDNKPSALPLSQPKKAETQDLLRSEVLLWTTPDASGMSPTSKLTFWGRSDSISDERMPALPVECSPESAAPVEAIELERDLYAFSLAPQIGCLAAFCSPVISATAQLAVLYFLAYQNENMFEEGKWKQPISPYWSLNVMKVISIAVSLFKVSTELQNAQQLCRSLLVGRFMDTWRLVAGWWSLSLQYSTGLCVLFVSLSIVLGATSCVGCFLKIFSVFIIVDMDNLAVRFLDGMMFLDFHVVVDPERLQRYRRKRGTIRGLSIRLIFMIMPITLIVASWIVSMYFNTTPLTLLAFGKVDNLHAPKMINIGGCCPPNMKLEHLKGEGLAANVSVLLLAALDTGDRPVPPRLHWIALDSQAEPIVPSSLQVLRGNDGNNNAAFRAGSAQTVRSQAYHWMEAHVKSQTSTYYKDLLKQEKLYKTTEPFEGSFLISGIQAEFPTTYTVFVTAENPHSRALAGTPAKASLLIPACSPFCESCELSGSHLCDPGKCIKGTHYHQGRCWPCVDHCESCEFGAAPLDFGVVNLTDSESIPCDYGGCKDGFGLHAGRCLPCKVEDCRDCYEDLAVCGLCKPGLGLDNNGTCQQCGGPHCRCFEKGGCEECENGWGPAENATCVECADGCSTCPVFHTKCKECELGFVLEREQCQRCVPHCRNCTVSGLDSCDECFPGFGLNMLTMKCNPCEVEHCLQCNGDQRRCSVCESGFGVTPEGLCQDCGEFCKECDAIHDCKVCQEGFVSLDGLCLGCADRCGNCDKAGPAKCDRCFQGFHVTQEGICELGATQVAHVAHAHV